MNIRSYLSFIKFSHTLFAMPFAIVGFFMATGVFHYDFNPYILLYVLLCMVFARNAAMAFNRWADHEWDAGNERTAQREIPAGIIKPKNALIFIVVNSLGFIITTFFINSLCFYLSPIALMVILGYSYTKRFTYLSHFVLGVGLGLAPIGAFLALSGEFKVLPVFLSVAVWAWVSGFDILYSIQDISFDKDHKLFSVPAKFGIVRSLWISRSMHILSALFIIGIAIYANTGVYYLMGAFVFISLLFYQHTVVRNGKLDRINFAFFNLNGIASVIFALFAVIEFLN
ncbi:MAG: UbiA-like polyprenyltransferase [Salinivirgaceae bacterium]|nr:UbiA-like polyprenyltransferase [Salinivirgaceae bacterium]